MSFTWILFFLVAALAACLLVWLAWRWLARSWEVLDDDQLAHKLGSPRANSPLPGWQRLLGWFAIGPRRLTYRRDKRGRFRRIWRG